MAECTNCGAELAAGARICGVCSYPVSTPTQQPTPPTAPVGPGAPQALGGQGQYQSQGPPLVGAVAVRKTDSSAIAALVLGILGLVVCPFILSIIAIVLGKQAERRINGSGGALDGEQMAKAGWILGWVGIALWGGAVLLWLVFFGVLMGFNSYG